MKKTSLILTVITILFLIFACSVPSGGSSGGDGGSSSGGGGNNGSNEIVSAPIFSPCGGTYTTIQNVAITTTTSDASIRYTTDGSAPTSSYGTIYTDPINVSSSTLKAIAYKKDCIDSSVTTEIYTITGITATPTFSISGGIYTTTKKVYIYNATYGSTVRYTTDGSTPTSTHGTVYSFSAIEISSITTLKAIAYKTGLEDSDVASATYTIKVKDPEIDPEGGVYTSDQNVTITTETEDAAIRYTIDGTIPTSTYGNIYTGPIPVSLGITTINAIAYKSNLLDSETITTTYTIHYTTKWSFSTGNCIESSPAISNDGNTIYAGSHDGNLYAINTTDGVKKWSFTAPSPYSSLTTPINSSPAVGNDGTIYIGTAKYDCKLYALTDNGTSYTEKWSFPLNDIPSSAAISNDGNTIYVGTGSSDGYLYAINAANGTEIWKYDIGNSVKSPVIGNDGTIYVGAYYCGLYAINPNGTLKWIWDEDASDREYLPSIGSDGTIYAGKDKLYALSDNGTSCSLKWAYDTIGLIGTPIIGSDGTIYVVPSVGMAAINPDGTLKWTWSTSDIGNTAPAISADGTIFVSGTGYNFYAIDADGNTIWSYNTKTWALTSSAIGNDGTIYFGCDDNNLYALNTLCGGLADSPWPRYRKNNQNTGRQ